LSEAYDPGHTGHRIHLHVQAPGLGRRNLPWAGERTVSEQSLPGFHGTSYLWRRRHGGGCPHRIFKGAVTLVNIENIYTFYCSVCAALSLWSQSYARQIRIKCINIPKICLMRQPLLICPTIFIFCLARKKATIPVVHLHRLLL